MRQGYGSTKYIALILVFWSFSILLNFQYRLPPLKISAQEKRINLSSKTLYLNLGLKRMISSYLWIKTLLDADHEHYESGDLGNWLFLRFKTMTDLDPNFIKVYTFGGMYLSVIKDDITGANYLFDKGNQYAPQNYTLNYYSALHYFGEVKDYDKALKHMLRIKDDPRTPEIFQIYMLHILEKKNFSKADHIKWIEDAFENVSNPILKNHLKEKLMKAKGK